MTNGIEAPRRGSGIGCFGKGCGAFLGLLLFLTIAFVGGGYWALRHLQNTYSSTEPLTFANVASSDSSLPEVDEGAPAEPGAAPVIEEQGQTIVPAEPVSVREVQARWRAFEKAADRHQPAHIELSAAEINALIDNDPKLRGKAAVTINHNVARVRVSVPLDGVFMMNGRYLNGEATVEPSPDGDPTHARITNIILANQAVADSALDRRLFGWSSIRGYMTDWLDDKDIRYFTIQDNRVIGESGRQR